VTGDDVSLVDELGIDDGIDDGIDEDEGAIDPPTGVTCSNDGR